MSPQICRKLAREMLHLQSTKDELFDSLKSAKKSQDTGTGSDKKTYRRRGWVRAF